LNRIFLAENLVRIQLLSFATALTSLLLPTAGLAQAMLPTDSSRLSRRLQLLGEVQVRAVRPEQFAVGSRHQELDSAALSQFWGGTVADVLQARTSLYLKTYGPGQLATMSMRGTSAQHTAVLWNGLNIMLPTLGQNDFALLPLAANSHVAVQPGPAAALYGSGAIGGAVLLSTAPDWRRGGHASVQADAGSFGLRGGSLAASVASEAVAVRLAASYRQAANNYPYTMPMFGGPVQQRLRSAALHHQWSVSPEVAWRLGVAGELTATAWLTDSDRDIQPAVGTTDRHARQQDQSRRVVLGYRHQASARSQWLVRGAWFEDVLNYQDDGLTSNSRVHTTQGQAEYTAALGAHGSLRLGAEAQHFRAALLEYGRPEVAENRAAAFALLRYDPRPRLRLTANLRQAALPQAKPLTPTLGLEWDLLVYPSSPAKTSGSGEEVPLGSTHRLTFKASAARSYRAPTLNERYWQAGGNPDLRPEAGLGYEVGLAHHSAFGRHLDVQTELTAYRQLVDDWVQWTPGANGQWSPRNLRQVLTQGIEASSGAAWHRGRHHLSARAAYAYTWARTHRATPADPVPAGQPLPYVPAHVLTGSLDYSWRGWQASASSSFTSYRYTDAGGVSFLPGYALLGGSAGCRLPLPGPIRVLVLLQASNLLNEAYDSYEGRPAPPRAASLSLRLSWR
jgi:vitamin B12 transporter